MIRTETLARLRGAMHEIAAQKGDFTLFGVFVRTYGPGTLDLVVAAPWLHEDNLKAIQEIVDLLTGSLGRESLLMFARVVTLREGDPGLEALLSAVAVDDGEVRIEGSNFFNLEIEEAVILRAMRAA